METSQQSSVMNCLMNVCLCVCVFVCVTERQGKKDRHKNGKRKETKNDLDDP